MSCSGSILALILTCIFSEISFRFARILRLDFAETKQNMCLGKRNEEALFQGNPICLLLEVYIKIVRCLIGTLLLCFIK